MEGAVKPKETVQRQRHTATIQWQIHISCFLKDKEPRGEKVLSVMKTIFLAKTVCLQTMTNSRTATCLCFPVSRTDKYK